MAMRKYYGSGGGGLGRILQFIGGTSSEGDITGAGLNQEVSSDFENKEGGTKPNFRTRAKSPKQYYSNDPKNYGQVVETPAFDRRGWFARGAGVPNIASDINTASALGNISGQQKNKFEDESRRSKAAFEDERFSSVLDQLEQQERRRNKVSTEGKIDESKQLHSLAIDQGKVPIVNTEFGLYGSPGDVRPDYKGMPEDLLERYLPSSPAGIEANAKLAEDKSQQVVRQSMIEENKRPRYSSVGNTLFRTDDTGARPEYTVEQGYDRDTTVGPDGKPIMGGRVPSRIISHRPVGNVYSNSGGSNGAGVTAPLYDINNLRGPASTQRQEYVTALDPEGGQPQKMEAQGEAPRTQPAEISVTSRQPTGVAPSVLDIFTPEMQEMAKTEFGRRLIRKLQSQAWDPISPTYGY